MTKTPEALARQQERAEKRRDQVLDAAQACFQREGFHAASVNRIATEAEMSVGHVYRYFDSKEDIIVALCERHFEDFISHTPRLPPERKADGKAMIAASMEDFAVLTDRPKAGFVMDVFAEAGRSKSIETIVADHDRRLRTNAKALLKPFFRSATDEELEIRVEMMVLILQGTLVRSVSDPDGDPDRLRIAFQHLLEAVLPPS